MKKITAWVLPLLIFACAFPSFTASAIVDQSAEFYVNDSAGVLSDNVEQAIIAANGDLEYYCKGAQIVVVTVDYSDGMYSDEYANKLFYDWGVGSDSENNGMLLLLIVEEGKGWLATGDGIDSVFTDNIAEKYLDEYFWDDFDDGDYDEAVSTLMDQLIGWYQNYYNVDTGENDNYDDSAGGGFVVEPEKGAFYHVGRVFNFLLRNIVIILIIAFIIYLIVRSDRTRYYSYYTHMGIAPPRRYRFWYMWGHRPYRRWTPPRPPRRPPPGGPGRRPPTGGGIGGFGSNNRSGSGFGGGGRSGGGGAGRSGRPGGSSSSRGGFGGFGGGSGGSSFGGGGFGGFGGGGRSGGGFGGGGRSGGGGGGRR